MRALARKELRRRLELERPESHDRLAHARDARPGLDDGRLGGDEDAHGVVRRLVEEAPEEQEQVLARPQRSCFSPLVSLRNERCLEDLACLR